MRLQCLPDLTNSVIMNHPGLTNWILTSNIFLLHKKSGFSEFAGLTNNWLGDLVPSDLLNPEDTV